MAGGLDLVGILKFGAKDDWLRWWMAGPVDDFSYSPKSFRKARLAKATLALRKVGILRGYDRNIDNPYGCLRK